MSVSNHKQRDSVQMCLSNFNNFPPSVPPPNFYSFLNNLSFSNFNNSPFSDVSPLFATHNTSGKYKSDWRNNPTGKGHSMSSEKRRDVPQMRKCSLEGPSKKQKPDRYGNWLRWKNVKGRFYYQNQKTGTIQWNQPKEVQHALNKDNWIEYKTAKGISFYCNIVTKEQTYKRPTEIKQNGPRVAPKEFKINQLEKKSRLESSNALLKDVSQMKTIRTSWVNVVQKEVTASINKTKTKSVAISIQKEYLDYEERKIAFQSLLKDKQVRPDEKWEKALRRFISDIRYRAIKTLKERKAFFTAYQKNVFERRKEEKSKKRQKAKKKFLQMLKDCPAVKPGSKFRYLIETLKKESWFNDVKYEDDRYRYFTYYVKELEQEKKNKQKKARKELKSLLECCKSLKYNSTRRDMDKIHNKNKAWNNEDITNEVRQQVFLNRVEELRKKHVEIETKERLGRQMREKKEDYDFYILLNEFSFKKNPPIFHSKTSYEDFSNLESVLNDPRFKIYDETDRLSARFRRFENFCWTMESKLRKDKKKLKDILKKNIISIVATDSLTLLLEKEKYNLEKEKISPASARVLFFEMIAKAVHKVKKNLQRSTAKNKKRQKRRKINFNRRKKYIKKIINDYDGKKSSESDKCDRNY